jgi:hypothetical protein
MNTGRGIVQKSEDMKVVEEITGINEASIYILYKMTKSLMGKLRFAFSAENSASIRTLLLAL